MQQPTAAVTVAAEPSVLDEPEPYPEGEYVPLPELPMGRSILRLSNLNIELTARAAALLGSFGGGAGSEPLPSAPMTLQVSFGVSR